MSANTAITWLLCAVACFGMAVVWDEPSETDAAQATALNVADGVAQARAAAKGRP